MKNKVIIGFCFIVFISMFILVGYILSSKYIQAKDNLALTQDNVAKNVGNANESIITNTEVEVSKKEYDNVVLNSKIGNKILSKFNISNIYSEFVYDKIDKNGLSNDAKLIYTYATIVSNYDYHNMIKTDKDSESYITKTDFETVYKSLFLENNNIIHKSFISEDLYNSENETYKFLSFGYGGVSFDFILEIPYEIMEYEDKVEVLFYRVYGTSGCAMSDDGNQILTVILYEDKNRTKEAYKGNEFELQQNDSQKEFVKSLIDDGKINKENLQKSVYILKEENYDYKISGYYIPGKTK